MTLQLSVCINVELLFSHCHCAFASNQKSCVSLTDYLDEWIILEFVQIIVILLAIHSIKVSVVLYQFVAAATKCQAVGI